MGTNDIRYITQLSKSDLSKMIAAGKMRPGPGIRITQDDAGFVIKLDKDVIVDIIWCYIQSQAAIGCQNAASIKDIRGCINLDPETYS